MQKLFFIVGFIACASIVTPFPAIAESSVAQLVRIMMSNNKSEAPSLLTQKRNTKDYEDVYNLVKKNPELLKGIIHNGRTFALLCVERGYSDLLERLINEGFTVDLATPCHEFGPNNPQTTVLHALFGQVWSMRKFTFIEYPVEYKEQLTRLTKLIIKKYPELLDTPVNKEFTAREKAVAANYRGYLGDLIPPRDMTQTKNDSIVE